MKLVKLHKRFGSLFPGEEAGFPDDEADKLVRTGAGAYAGQSEPPVKEDPPLPPLAEPEVKVEPEKLQPAPAEPDDKADEDDADENPPKRGPGRPRKYA